MRVLRLGMFEVHCDELIRTLVKRVDSIVARLLARMLKDHIESNKAYACSAPPVLHSIYCTVFSVHRSFDASI